ncbi:DNA endonuclease SmrA [Sphingomonas daechungensis]|uniref:Smr/MutS family protein n=1 Tax=Sphingomonas daechungensis TaxID=1176646 RepID=A0ABX6SXX4_9SPHN|nr:Smr/MutS family protein [Sphingomonas daechungensis]QNP42446.1 Smr/MutS family protein [Sphingomonas daechungensis]
MARPLSPDEAELWARVTATIRPLSREPLKSSSTQIEELPSAVEGMTPIATTKLKPPARENRSPQPPQPGRTLDGTWDRKLRSGSVQPDRIVDLHGLNLDQAWSAIDVALERAEAAGDRVLLLITGHHRPGEPPVARGRIRAAVHDWLAASRHAGRIAAVRGAHRRHGGGGSLYLVLRKR